MLHEINLNIYGDGYMFFIAGVSSKQNKLDFNQTTICHSCGKYGRYEVIMEYMFLSLFFIPVIKWNKKFYVKSICCESIYTISKELGNRIAKGENVGLKEQDLQLIQSKTTYFIKRCPNCGFETFEDYQYCPKCSAGLK
jgi:hypothetical protein